MASSFSCEHCDFDFEALPERIEFTLTTTALGTACLVSGGIAAMRCPMCGAVVSLRVASLGVIVRGMGGNAQFARWRTSGAADGHAASMQRGALSIRFDGMVSIEPKEACFERVPVFRNESGALCTPDVPLRPELFDCLDVVRVRSHVGPLSEVVGSMCHATLYLHGLADPVKVAIPLQAAQPGPIAKETAFAEINLRVWPKIAIKNWRHFLVGVAGTGEAGNALLREKKLFATARSGESEDWEQLDSIQRAGTSAVGAMQARPEWIAIAMLDATGRPTAGGLFLVPTGESNELVPAGTVDLGLDFGTSNTCVAYRIDDQPKILKPHAESDWNLYVLRGGPEDAAPAGPDLWPSPVGFGRQKDVFPSEILLPRSRKELGSALATVEAWRYGVEYGIPGAGVAPAFAEADHTIRFFKWKALLRAQGGALVDRIVALQSRYWLATLLNAYVRVAAQERQAPQVVSVTYSYPMAFDDEDLGSLSDAAAEAARSLQAATGLTWNIERGLDESAAAARNAGETSCNVLIYLDMGGGSTDIAVKSLDGKRKEDDVYLTSVAYAGSAVVDAFAGRRDDATGRRVGSCMNSNASVDALHRKVREASSTRDVIGDATLFNRAWLKVTEKRIASFYNYLTEYVARLVAAGLIERRFGPVDEGIRFGFFFLGNGWGFASQITEGDFASMLAERTFKRARLLLGQDKSEQAAALKKDLKPSALTMEVGRLDGVPHPKAAVAYGLLKEAGARRAYRSSGGGTRRGIVGVTTKVGRREVPVPWFAYYSTSDNGPPPATLPEAGDDWANLEKAHPFYAAIPPDAQLDWPNPEPAWPDDLEGPLELDERLNHTRGPMREGCKLDKNNRWFAQGPYEVLLERLFKPKLAEIG